MANDFHNHSPWTGPCSDKKHLALYEGLFPWQREKFTPEQIFETMFTYALEYSVVTEEGVLCACCRFNYTGS